MHKRNAYLLYYPGVTTMKKNKNPAKNKAIRAQNLVAKHAHFFNKALIFQDKSKYQRKAKHKNLNPFFMQYMHYIKNGFKFTQNHYILP